MPQGGANAAAGLTHRHGAGKVPSRSSSPKGTAAFPAGEFVSDAKGLKPHHTLFGNAPPAGSGMEADIAPYERYLPAAILLVALCTRFYRLTVPWGVVRAGRAPSAGGGRWRQLAPALRAAPPAPSLAHLTPRPPPPPPPTSPGV
jgi:hypothetical protein